MIDERYQVTARSIDNGEVVRGYLAHDEFCNVGVPYIGFASYHKRDWIEVDPATIEPVRVKPIKRNKHDEWNCPNCNSEFSDIGGINEMYYESEKYDFCPDCGQALDWTE